jgi:cell division septation protein DedD
VVGCSKKQDEIDALEQEATEEDAGAVMDSLEGTGMETTETVPAVPEEMTSQAEPEEEVEKPEYPEMEGFVVQLGSYHDYELANYWAEKYQNREYPAFIREVELGGETFYRLRVGVYDRFEEAREVGERLVDRYSATYWIDNNR